MSTDSRPASSHAGSKPSGMWQPPSLEEMQAMLPQYQFISLLGRGGMGAVYKAVQVSLDRAVAIKVLPGDLIDDTDAQFAERFKNEARTMAKMNHPAIVNVYDFGETQTGLLFIVMEFIDGTDASKMIASQGKLPPDYALAITAHVCDALNYAHSHSIVHRDIKPANILINMEGAVKVADFGLAKSNDSAQGSLTKTNMAMGTPDFVAPEALIPGMPLDGRADLYAIGVMLYQMLTGEIPRGMWTMPSAKLGTDPRFDAIIGKAMQTDRESRYQTAASIRRDLDVIMTTPPAAAKKPAEQAPQQRSADAPARNASYSDAGGPIRKETAAKPAERALASAATKKSNTGFYLGMAATVIALGVVVFLFSGGKKLPSEPQAAGKTKVVAQTPAPKPKTPKPAPPKTTVIAPSPTPKPVTSTTAPSPQPPITAILAFKGSRYQMVREPVKWPEAKAKAEAAGGHLATITDKETDDWIRQTLVSQIEPGKSVWFGARKEGWGKWAWVTDEPFNYTNFPPNAPGGHIPEHCAVWHRSSGADDPSPDAWWKESPASVSKIAGYLVEWDAPVTAAPGTVDTAPWTDAIALLPLVDVEKDTVQEGWKREGGDLVSGAKHQPALAELPVIPPEEYDLRVRFTKKDMQENLFVVLSRGDHSILWSGGAGQNKVFAFGHYKGGSSLKSLTSTNPSLKTVLSCFELNRAYTVQIAVRKTGVTAYLDGSKISQLPADLAEMQTPDAFKVRTARALGIGSWKTAYAVHAIELREVTGKVKYLREQPAADLVAQRLAQLEQQFLAAYEKQAGAAHKAAVADLNTKFTAALDRSIATVSKAGKLDEALALRNEKTLIQTSSTVPEADAADTAETLKTLRKTYRATMTTLLATRDKNAAPLHAAYDRALAAYQEELTKAQKLDDALRVKAVREHITTQRDSGAGTNAGTGLAPALGRGASAAATPASIAPTAPPLSADKVLPSQPKATPEEVRALVEWCLGVRQGTVEVLDSGQRRRVTSLDDLPKGKLTLLHFFIYDQPMNDDWKKWLAVLGRVPELESLFFYKNPGPFPIEALRGLTKLKSLHLSPATMDEAAFAHLGGLKSLEQLYLGCNQFTGTGLGYIGENLQDLTTDSKTISAEGLAYLPRFKKLKRLDLTNSSVTDDMLQGLAALSELEFLDVKSTNLDGSFLAHLPPNSKIKQINFYNMKNFKPENLALLSRLKNLELLTLPPANPGPAEMAAIASLSKLSRLEFRFSTFTGESFKGAKGFSSLVFLDLGDAPITDAGWQEIGALSSLEELVFSRPAKSKAPMTAAAFGTHLGQMRNLKVAAIISGGITDEWMPAIAELKNLTRLSLQGAGITDAGLMHLSKLPLQEINIGQTAVTDAGLQTLKTFPKLFGAQLPATSATLTDAAKEELLKFLAGRKGK